MHGESIGLEQMWERILVLPSSLRVWSKLLEFEFWWYSVLRQVSHLSFYLPFPTHWNPTSCPGIWYNIAERSLLTIRRSKFKYWLCPFLAVCSVANPSLVVLEPNAILGSFLKVENTQLSIVKFCQGLEGACAGEELNDAKSPLASLNLPLSRHIIESQLFHA